MADDRDALGLQAALAWADSVRIGRRDLVAGVARGLDVDGVRSAIGAFAELGDTYVVVVIQAVPGLGKIGARRRLAAHGIGEFEPIGSIDSSVLEQLFVPGDRPVAPLGGPADGSVGS